MVGHLYHFYCVDLDLVDMICLGIGHMLGPFGVGHGETSCILLPSVCKYNSTDPTALEHQHRTLSVLWSSPYIASMLEARGLK